MKNQIIIDVELDNEKIPEKIFWAASQAEQAHETRAFFLSIFDPKAKDTLKIDLWTKEMSVQDMMVFMHNTLKAMGRSYAKAIGSGDVVTKFDDFANGLLAQKR